LIYKEVPYIGGPGHFLIPATSSCPSAGTTAPAARS
jgi:hypothetical protein